MTSKISTEFFHKAILLSGSVLNPFMLRQTDHRSILHNLAESLHYPVANENDLIEFLKQVDGKVLTKKTFQDDYTPGLGRKTMNRVWTVVVESNVCPTESIKKKSND